MMKHTHIRSILTLGLSVLLISWTETGVSGRDDAFRGAAGQVFFRAGSGVSIQRASADDKYGILPAATLTIGRELSPYHTLMIRGSMVQPLSGDARLATRMYDLDAFYGLNISSLSGWNRSLTVMPVVGGGFSRMSYESWQTSGYNLQGGVDLSLRLSDSFSAYFNPMVRVYFGDNESDIWSDVTMLPTVGLQYRLGVRKEAVSLYRDSWTRTPLPASLDAPTGSFCDHTFVTVLGGAVFKYVPEHDYAPGYGAGLEFGKRINPTNSLMLDLRYDWFTDRSDDSPVEQFEAGLLHSFVFPELRSAADSRVGWGFRTIGGVGVSINDAHRTRTVSGVLSLGVELGMNFGSGSGIFLRPSGKGYIGDVAADGASGFGLGAVIDAGVRIGITNGLRNGMTADEGGKDEDKADDKPDGYGKYGFNALKYALQGRRTLEGKPFVKRHSFDHTFLYAGYGLQSVASDINEYNLHHSLSIGFGWWTGRHNCISLTGFAGTMTAKKDIADDRLAMCGADFMHSFNISSYVFGYDPRRMFEVSTTEGLGFDISKNHEGWGGHAGHLRLGLDFKLRISDLVSLCLDPFWKVYTAGVDRYDLENWRNYNLGYGATLGVRLDLTSSGR